MGAEFGGLENLKQEEKDQLVGKADVPETLADSPKEDPKPENTENTKKEKKAKNGEFNLEKVGLKMQNKVFELRSKKQIEHLENEGEEFTAEQEAEMEKELQRYALDLLKEEKKKHRKEKIENSGPLMQYYHKASKWYGKLDDTPNGRIGKKFLETGISGSLYLGTATATSMISPANAMWKLGTRIAVVTGFEAAAVKTMQAIAKKNPNFLRKIGNIFAKKNETSTQVPEFKQESVTSTGAVNFAPENTNTTIPEQKLIDNIKSIDFRKLKYAGIALGTSFVFFMGGWVAAVATGTALVTKEQLSDLLKRKIEKYEAKMEALSSELDFNSEGDAFMKTLKETEVELDKITKTIKELELIRSVIKGTLTFANGLAGTAIQGPSEVPTTQGNTANGTGFDTKNIAGSSRRLATAPAGEIKEQLKVIAKKEKKDSKNTEEEKIAA